ncbi:MAG: rhomboid family intramembrane serine protease, partial [Ignavibacteriales bacterium]|nr:rhomboid family intramembrane serine protease [Ignavibacteriales bacterium]
LLARSSYHIGASGIVYGFAAFLFFSGVFRKDVKSIALALLVAFIYGGLVWGVLPVVPGVSWESHLFGAVSGTFTAYILRKYDKQKKYDWENERSDIPKEKLEISYKKGYPWDEK